MMLLVVAYGGASSTSASGRRVSNNPSLDRPTGEPTKAQAALVAARPVTVHVPPSYSRSTPAPLLMLLHGSGDTGASQEEYLRLTPAATAHGMLYVTPDGTRNAYNSRIWNATDACCGSGVRVDDSAYLRAVIAEVKANYNVDPRRVFLVGHSNGGFMAFRMACDHADEIAAIVSIAGATFADSTRCEPTQGVATLQIHGTADPTIKYGGGTLRGEPYPSARITLETWARYNGCGPEPDRPAPPRRAIEVGLRPARVRSYSAGCGRSTSELWTQRDGVHIPTFEPTFPEQLVEFLLAHPKR